MAEGNGRWRDAEEDELLAAAESRLAELRREQEKTVQAAVSRQQDQRSIPELSEALRLARY